jgi:hypothetical protein
MTMTLIQAQQRYIDRVNHCHPGHARRVRNSAWRQLRKWAEVRGLAAITVCKDADDMAVLERNSSD